MEIEQGNGRELDLGLAKVKLKDQESASGQSDETVTAVSPSAYLWKGFSDDLQTLTFDFFSQCKIISVSLGSQHSLFLTDKGLVFAQGSNGLGQLGQGSVEIREFPEPVQVTGLPTPVTAIASGTSHNAAVTSEGQVFCWGSSMEGQCGTGCLDIVPSPSLVPVEINTGFCEHGVPNPATPVAIQSVSCGNSHTLAISWENEIWAWGAGPQLGLGDLMHAPIPRCLDSLKGKVAVAVCCGSSHSLALLLAKSKLTGTPNSSPVKTKKMVAAKATEIKEDKLYPSRCTVCNNEIYTFTENSDTCVIDALHECKPSGANSDIDQTIVEDVFTSSSSQGEREDEVDSCLAKSKKMDQVGGEANDSQRFEKLQGDMIKKATADDNESVAALSVSSSESSDNPVGETSILVVHSDDPLEAKGESISVTESDDSVSNIHNTNVGAKDCNSYEDSGGKDIKAMEKREHISMAAGQNVAAGNCQSTSSKSKDSLQEKHEPEDKQGPSKTRQRSASGTSVRSLTMLNQPVSEAMEYLQRQFEDEDLAEGQSQGSEKLHKASPSGKTGGRNLSFENVLGYPSSMVAQVKSMTSLAWTNIGTFSVFNSSGQLADSDSSNKVNVSGLNQDEQAMQSLKSSAGSSSLESAFRDSPDSGISGSDTCNSLARWSKDISAVDPDPSSLDSTGQRSLRTIQMQQRNLSSSRVSISDGQTDQRPRVVTATEVWVWGKNEHFQLGIGDQLDRASPTELKLLRGHHVVKVAAGQFHSLALTSNSQVFSWGTNSYGQLGRPLDDRLSPMRIKMSKSCTAWDIAAGENHSIFLGDSAGKTPEVFYCGKQRSENRHTSIEKTSQLVPLKTINKVGWITSVAAGGDNCSCVVLNPAPSESRAVFAFAATERHFYYQLIKTTNSLIRPLKKCDFYKSMDVYPYKSCIERMESAFGSLIKKTGEGITDFTRCIQSHTPVSQSNFVKHHGEFISAFQQFSQTFSDLLAVGGFDFCTKIGIEFFEKVHAASNNLADERNKDGASTLLLRAMRYPFCRLAEYANWLASIAKALKAPHDAAEVRAVSLAWDEQRQSFSQEHKTAEATRVFWETQASKAMVDSMKVPARRLLRESKTHPLYRLSGSRFSHKLFVLFNDTFVLVQSSGMLQFPLETVWVDQSTPETENPNGITILTPEDRFELVASSSEEKAQWLLALNSAISKIVTNQKSLSRPCGSQEQVTPPLVRHATHKFLKSGIYKGAVYQGSWLSGKVDGLGIMNFEDGSVYEGHFKRGFMHGSGTYTILRPGDKEIQKGQWWDGKLNGLATVSYSNGDLYEGYFQDGQRFGHGCYQGGRHNRASCTTTYVGEWNANMKDGYGVEDDILKGEKYMGMWVDDQRHGSGILVTLDGMYFEGNFVLNKLQGFGLMISDDNTVYEGDFMGTTHLSGKGTLTLPTGDKMEGTFNGSLNGGLKVNGTFSKSLSSPDSDKRHGQHPVIKPRYFGHLCVSADSKWTDIFSHTISSLAQTQIKSQTSDPKEKAWEVVAIMVSAGRKALKNDPTISARKAKAQLALLDSLEKIPACRSSKLDRETVEEIAAYLTKAFDAAQHPLGRLMESVGEVFRASYIGVGAHPRLLPHALQEIRSYVKRIYGIVRILFPVLPPNGGPMCVYPAESSCSAAATADKERLTSPGGRNSVALDQSEKDLDDPDMLVLTSAGLIYPILLPKIYPPLFDLYALHNGRADDLYWERVMKLNRQSDMGLMAYLGVEQRFWLMEDVLKQDTSQKLSTIKDLCYAEAIDMLQQLSTAFSPIEKLKLIEQTFNEVTKTVSERISGDVMWCMDDLFPIFQFVVVRAKLQHLGAEIHLMEDLMEAHLEHGEFGIMLTTLKACYFQIQNEQMPHH